MHEITVLERNLTFEEAFSKLKQGAFIKCPEWEGYWKKEGPQIIVYKRDGTTADTPWLKETIFREDWQTVSVQMSRKMVDELINSATIRKRPMGYPSELVYDSISKDDIPKPPPSFVGELEAKMRELESALMESRELFSKLHTETWSLNNAVSTHINDLDRLVPRETDNL